MEDWEIGQYWNMIQMKGGAVRGVVIMSAPSCKAGVCARCQLKTMKWEMSARSYQL